MMYKKYLLSGLLFIAVLGLVLYYRKELTDTLYSVHKGWSVAGFFCILFNYLIRSLRLYWLTGKELTLWPRGVYCTSMHGFLNYMLPLRSGDLSLPFLLKETAKIELKKGITVLYKARLLEIFTLGIWIVMATLIPFSNLPTSIMVSLVSLGTVMILTPFFLHSILKRIHLPFERIQRLSQHLSETSQMTAQEIVLTFGIWASIALCIGCIAKAMQLTISPSGIAFLIAIQLIMQLMPIQGFANSGNHESSWAAALMLMGFPADLSLKFALTSHAIILVYVLILGLLAVILRFAILGQAD